MRKLLAIIPARGGSKRLKDKNIYTLLGKPLIAYAIEACQASEFISNVVVSSDSDKILQVAEESGVQGLKRPEHLADDRTPKIIVVREVINQLEGILEFDDVAIIQANSPELKPEHIDMAYRLMLEHDLWEVMSADENGVQNAAIRIVKKEVVFQEFLSAHCGFITCNLLDVHTLQDVEALEKRMA